MSLKTNTQQYAVIFFIGFLISLIATFYQHIRFDILNLNFETSAYVNIDISNSSRLPMYPYFTLFIFKIFGSDNYLAISIIQSLINGVTIFTLFAIKNFFTKKFFWTSLFLLGFNINFFWSSTIILPDNLYVFFLTIGMFFFLKFIYKKQLLFYIFIGSIFLFFASLTKPVGLLLPFFLSFFLLFFLLFRKEKSFSRIIICIFIPIFFCNVLASKINYKLTGKSITTQKSSHLLYWVYPCLKQKWGCGARDSDSLNKVLTLAENKIKKLENITHNEKLPDKFIVKPEHYKIQMEIFYDEIKKIPPFQIILSTFGSTLKLLFHTPIVGIFARHDISYIDLKSIISIKDFNFSINGSIWLLFQIILILLRLVQLYGLFSLFKSNSEKNFWSIIFLISFILPFLITSIGMGNFRYRIPIEPALFILTIIGLKKINKKVKLSLYKR
tara:strand:+ start:2946 stop:4271 length:1326 start_codon:yes stop_codon:yes gene_type:complete